VPLSLFIDHNDDDVNIVCGCPWLRYLYFMTVVDLIKRVSVCSWMGVGGTQGVPSQQLLGELAGRGDPDLVMAAAINVSDEALTALHA
jgi:hypothetical protein